MKLFPTHFLRLGAPRAAGVLCLFLFAASLRGAEPVTLDDLVAETLASNPELKFYEAEIAAARGGRQAAGAWANPELSGEFGNKRVRDFDGNKLGDGAVWSASLSQTFEFPGRVSLRKAIANRQLDLAQLGLEQFRAALAVRVRTLGYKVMAAQQRSEAAQEVAKRFQDLLAVLLQRDTAGVAPLLETRIIEANAFTLNRKASEASIAMRDAQFELNQLRGLPVSTPVAVAKTNIALKTPPALEPLLAAGRTNNFDIRTRAAELEQQGLRVKLSENERWPSVTLAPYTAGENASDREREFGLGVTVALPILNQNAGNIATAKARQLQAEVSLTVAMREVERKIATAVHAYERRLIEMSKWPADAAEKFRQAARSGDEHYRLGAIPVATYTELQKQYLEVVDALLSTQEEALASRQELQLLTGTDLGDLPRKAPAEKPAIIRPTPPKPTR